MAPPGHTEMDYTVAMMPSATRTRVLVSQEPDELLRAVLPPPASVHHEQAVASQVERDVFRVLPHWPRIGYDFPADRSPALNGDNPGAATWLPIDPTVYPRRDQAAVNTRPDRSR